MQDTAGRMQDTRCRIPDAGCRILFAAERIGTECPGSKIKEIAYNFPDSITILDASC
jgi:hypothetical protein